MGEIGEKGRGKERAREPNHIGEIQVREKKRTVEFEMSLAGWANVSS